MSKLSGKVAIKGIENFAPVGLAVGDLIELSLELRGEAEVEQVVEILDQPVGDQFADLLGG